MFGIFSESTSHIWFSSAIFILRIIVGLQVFLFGLSRLSDWSVIGELGSDAWFKVWFSEAFASSWLESVLPWAIIILGILVIFGIMIRPTSLALIVIFLIIYAWSFDSGEMISLPLIMIGIFGFFMSGGVGHIIGMDHILYHYAREKTCVTKLLLG